MTAEKFLLLNNFKTSEEALMAFAKYHVTEALKSASEEATSYIISGLTSEVETESILNSYPLDLIK